MTLDEQLSRYLDGDLPAEATAALERRIANESEVASALEEMVALRDALRSLPEEMTPPPYRPARSSGWPVAAGLLLAAAVLLFAVWPSTRPHVVLTEGVSELEGVLRIDAASLQIELDGAARIVVEPLAPLVRGAAQTQEEWMDPRNVISAGAGAAVTVLVMQGSAMVSSPDGASVAVEAGEQRSFGAAVEAAPLPDDPQARAEALQAQIAALSSQLEKTESALAEQRFAGQLAQGQLEQLQGPPSPWPDDVPDALSPAGFEEGLRDVLGELPVKIEQVDCTEYPCVGAVRFVGEGGLDEWGDQVGGAVKTWLEGELGPGQLSVTGNQSTFGDEDGETSFMVFGAHQGERNDGVGRRTESRIRAVVDELGENLRE